MNNQQTFEFQESKNQILTQKNLQTFTTVTVIMALRKMAPKTLTYVKLISLEQHSQVCHSARQLKRTIFQQQFLLK
jgi:hypothetical protein